MEHRFTVLSLWGFSKYWKENLLKAKKNKISCFFFCLLCCGFSSPAWSFPVIVHLEAPMSEEIPQTEVQQKGFLSRAFYPIDCMILHGSDSCLPLNYQSLLWYLHQGSYSENTEHEWANGPAHSTPPSLCVSIPLASPEPEHLCQAHLAGPCSCGHQGAWVCF